MNIRTLSGAFAAPLLISIALSARPVRELPGEYDGRIDPSEVVQVSANTDGRLESCAVDRGDLVEVGQELARMDDRIEALTVQATELRAASKSDIAAATAEIQQLTSRIDKRAALYADGTLVGSELDDLRDKRELVTIELAKAEETHAEAQVDLERAKALLERTRVRSTIRGVVLQRLASPGEYVNRTNGGSVFKIATLDPLEVEVHVPPARAAALRVGGQVEVRPEATEQMYLAIIKQVDKVVDTASGSVAVRLTLENKQLAIAAGLRCKVHFVD